MRIQIKQKTERKNGPGSKRGIFFVGLLCMMLCSTVLGGGVSYDLERDNVSMGYDDGGRVLNRGDYVYVYDDGRVDSLTNVSDGEVVVSYEYDERGRIVREVRVIDGIGFEKVVEYDSMDRVVSEGELDFEYGDFE